MATITKKEKETFKAQVYARATAASVAISSGILPLSTQFELQKQLRMTAPSTKVATSTGDIIDLRNHTTNNNSTSFHSYNNRLTSMPKQTTTTTSSNINSNTRISSTSEYSSSSINNNNNNKINSNHTNLQHHYDVSLLTPSPQPTTTTLKSPSYRNDVNSCVINLMNDESVNEEDDNKEKGVEVEKIAYEMFDRVVAKGNEKLSEIVRKRGDRSKDESKKKKVLRRTVKLLNEHRKSGDQISTIFSITNNGKHLIPGAPDQMQSPECLESVIELYSDDDQN